MVPVAVAGLTAARLLSLAEEIGYRPKPMAGGLKTKGSQAIGVLIPTYPTPFPPIVRGIEDTIGFDG
ncbi:MAG: hypothetical protein GEU78_11630 [Actinobacteria bacterium]|nr:hypothetical protein [Actinomycetota bacterium]